MTRTFECTNKKLQSSTAGKASAIWRLGRCRGGHFTARLQLVVKEGLRSKDAGCVVAAKIIMDV